MATSGQINTNTTYESYFWVKWEQSGNQDIANNRTQIAWSCGVYCGHNFALNAIRMSAVTINRVQVYAGGTYSDFSKGNRTIASGTLWIDHSTDGTKTFTISPFTGWLYSNHNYSSNGDSYSLTQIPRQAMLTAAPNFTDLQNPTISYSNPAGDAVSDLRACISFTGAKDDIAYRTISKTGGTYTFNLTDVERDVLRNNTTGTKRQVIFFVRSVIGGVTYYSIIERTLTIVESDYTRPSVIISAPVNNGALPGGFGGLYIQGKSKVDVAISAKGKYNASISSYSTNVDGKTYTAASFTTSVITKSGTITIASTVKDSRGFSGSASQQITVTPYSAPWITSFSVERQTDGTTVIAKLKGGVSPVSNKNSKAFSITLNGETKTIAASGYEVDETVTFTDVPTDTTLTAQATITDAFSSATKTATIPTVAVTMDFHSGGNGVAFGKVAEHENRLDVAWPIVMRKGFAAIDLTNSQDLNSFKITGFYRCTQDAIAKTLTNCPTDQAFSLLIEQHAGYKQTLTTYRTDTPAMYIRNCYMDVWGPWYKVTLTKV